MKKLFLIKFKSVFLSSLFVSLFLVSLVQAESKPTPTPTSSSNRDVLENKIKELEEKITSTQNTEKSLKSEISNLDNQITATNYKIQVAEDDIKDKEREITFLKQDISFLEDRLVKIKDSIAQYEKLVDVRMREKYKSTRSSGNLSLLLADENGFTNFISRLKYAKVAEDRDKNLLMEMKTAENSYQSQQGVLQDKKDEIEKIKTQIEDQKNKMESLKLQLDDYKDEKNNLLKVTQNDEERYQEMLKQAKAELDAIENIVGSVNFSNGAKIKKGTPIAIMGNSGYPNCSNGAHLHLEVRKNGVVVSPLNYLKKESHFVYDYTNGDRSLGSGKWDWPMKGLWINQLFGKTPWSFRYPSGRHDGIDMESRSTTIYAIADGTIVRGTMGCGGPVINYVAINHGDGVVSYYLHVK